MRSLVALLVLANAAFLAWSQWIAHPASRPDATAVVAPRLVLASEAPVAPPLPAVRTDPGVNCLSLGPFLDLTETARASTALREAGLEPRQRATDGAVWAGYWVSLSGIADAGDAERIVERLRQFGVGDAYVMPPDQGDLGPVVSLGLFTEQQRALRRVDEVRALGYQPAVSERRRSGTVYWIDVDVAAGRQLPDTSSLEGGAGRIFRLEVKPCEEADPGSEPQDSAELPAGTPG